MKLGVDLFSTRLQKWTPFESLEYCHRIGVDVVHFSEPNMLGTDDEGELREIKARADELGLDLEVGMGSICPTSLTFNSSDGLSAPEAVSKTLRVAHALGSPIMRCFLGKYDDRLTDGGIRPNIDATVETCQAVRAEALDLGVKLAIENHAGDLLGREMKELIERAGPEHVGACIDSGNPLWICEDPMVTLEHLAPYVVSSHVRDTCVWSHPRGAVALWTAMGDGNVGMEEWSRRFQELCPESAFTLEIITGLPPRVLATMEDDFWTAFPETPAAEYVRFERLVRNGQPFMGDMIQFGAIENPPPAYGAARVAQQLVDLERSVTYCRETLGIGSTASRNKE